MAIENNRKLTTIAWELISKCNFNCLHCYNSETLKATSEFSLEKALSLCDEINELKAEYVLLTGGEILLSNIWKPTAKKLIDYNIEAGILTNGWLFNQKVLDDINDIGLKWVAFSLDGLRETHDYTRKKGSFDRIMNALDMLKGHDAFVSINTTVHKKNINEIGKILEIMNEKEVNAWQMQLAIPEGNLINDENSIMISPEDIDTIIDFAYNNYKTSKTRVVLGDCIGHYNQKEIEVRSKVSLEHFGTYNFVNGCQAGIRVAGIKANGDVTGCIALSDKYYISGNVHNRNLVDIWNDENSFTWNRNADTSRLKGNCSICMYKEYCRSGCPSLYFDKNFQVRENKYCSYNVALTKKLKEIEQEQNLDKLVKEKEEAIEYENKYLAEIIDNKINSIQKNPV